MTKDQVNTKGVLTTIVYGAAGTLGGCIMGSIEGFYSTFAMPTNVRTLAQRIPEKIDSLAKNAGGRDIDKLVGFTAYYGFKYPIRVLGNLGTLYAVAHDISQGHFGRPLILAATNTLSFFYEASRNKHKQNPAR